MPFTPFQEARVHKTQNATMRSYATPSQNGSDLAVWRTDMPAGAAGPMHRVDRGQVLVVIEGRAQITLDNAVRDLEVGDAVFIPAGAQRSVANPFERGAAFVTAGGPHATAETETASAIPIPWTN